MSDDNTNTVHVSVKVGTTNIAWASFGRLAKTASSTISPENAARAAAAKFLRCGEGDIVLRRDQAGSCTFNKPALYRAAMRRSVVTLAEPLAPAVERLLTCPRCERYGFYLQGLQQHVCRGANAGDERRRLERHEIAEAKKAAGISVTSAPSVLKKRSVTASSGRKGGAS